MSDGHFISSFEELVLTAVLDVGQGADEVQVWRKVRKLASRNTIRLIRVKVALSILESGGCVHSWLGEPSPEFPQYPNWPLRHYRLQLRGERALETAIENRGSEPLPDYFRRAGRFGILWDVWRGCQARIRADKQRLSNNSSHHASNSR